MKKMLVFSLASVFALAVSFPLYAVAGPSGGEKLGTGGKADMVSPDVYKCPPFC